MAKGKPVALCNGREFPTKKSALDFFRNIIHSVSDKITKDHVYYSDVLSLYLNHPEFVLKSYQEESIDYFQVLNSGQFNTKCFHTIHKDGSKVDWSYKTACDSKTKSVYDCFVDGARYALEVEYSMFRDDCFNSRCKKFVELNCSDGSVPTNWISTPEKLQYRTTLHEPIRIQFVNWYRDLYILS